MEQKNKTENVETPLEDGLKEQIFKDMLDTVMEKQGEAPIMKIEPSTDGKLLSQAKRKLGNVHKVTVDTLWMTPKERQIFDDDHELKEMLREHKSLEDKITIYMRKMLDCYRKDPDGFSKWQNDKERKRMQDKVKYVEDELEEPKKTGDE